MLILISSLCDSAKEVGQMLKYTLVRSGGGGTRSSNRKGVSSSPTI